MYWFPSTPRRDNSVQATVLAKTSLGDTFLTLLQDEKSRDQLSSQIKTHENLRLVYQAYIFIRVVERIKLHPEESRYNIAQKHSINSDEESTCRAPVGHDTMLTAWVCKLTKEAFDEIDPFASQIKTSRVKNPITHESVYNETLKTRIMTAIRDDKLWPGSWLFMFEHLYIDWIKPYVWIARTVIIAGFMGVLYRHMNRNLHHTPLVGMHTNTLVCLL